MAWIGGEQPVEIAVVSLRRLEGVKRLFFLVVTAQRLAQLAQRIDALARGDQWALAGDFLHQRVDIFELLERRPARIACPPVRTRPQPYRKGLGEILVRMALRIPAAQVLDIAPAGRIGPVIARVAFRGRAEQLLPAPAAVQLVGVLHGMTGFMTQNRHALRPGAALDLEHHFLLELHQAGMGEIERDRNAGRVFRAEPLARYPGIWPQPDAPLFELAMESLEAILKPGAFDPDPQTAEAALEQLLVRQRFPIEFPARHRASERGDNSASGWCHGMLLATTAACSRRGKKGKPRPSPRPVLRSKSVFVDRHLRVERGSWPDYHPHQIVHAMRRNNLNLSVPQPRRNRCCRLWPTSTRVFSALIRRVAIPLVHSGLIADGPGNVGPVAGESSLDFQIAFWTRVSKIPIYDIDIAPCRDADRIAV